MKTAEEIRDKVKDLKKNIEQKETGRGHARKLFEVSAVAYMLERLLNWIKEDENA